MRAPRAGSIEEKVERLRAEEAKASQQELAYYERMLTMSWIHHDNALEGVVYAPRELEGALDDQIVADSSLMPVYQEIRHYKEVIEYVRELARSHTGPITLDTIKTLYTRLAPEEAEGKNPPKYRREMPLHRLYFHEIAQPDKISYRMRQLVQWMGSADTKRATHPVRFAARAHYRLLHIFPFPKHSGKLARLLMNLILMRDGYPPAILHSTDRQRYYDALKTSSDSLAKLVNEALTNSVNSALNYFQRELATAR